jgi:D-alanine-D-alanine ligase-like ATP-grasp enzyme
MPQHNKKSHRKDPSPRRTFVSEILCRIAPRIGATVFLEPDYGFVGEITFREGKKALFRDRNFNINPQGSSEIARDKGYADFFLRRYGYDTIEGQTFFSEKLNERLTIKRSMDDGFRYAGTLGFPVVLKPNNLSQGTLVTKVHNKKEYYSAGRKILRRSSVMLVQRYYDGFDYRIVVLDDKVISAYQRIPLFVIGDGNSNVMKLALQKQKRFIRTGRDTEIELDDFRIALKLRRQKLGFKSVPVKGAQIFLLDNANLSAGGEAVDVTETIHRDFQRLAVNITKDMGLRMCGVDIITSHDISTSLRDYVIIEINSAPGLDNYASIGPEQEAKVDELYLNVLKALELS